jgi:hypothetical protein
MSSKFTRKHGLVLLGLLAVTGGAMMMRSGLRPPPPGSIFNNGDIGNGQLVSSSVTGTDTQSWTFFDANGSTNVWASVNYAGSDTHFNPKIQILNPNGTVKAQTSGTHSARLSTGALTATGTYKPDFKRRHFYHRRRVYPATRLPDEPALRHAERDAGWRRHVCERQQ